MKQKAGVPHAAGLVEQMLALKVNDRVNTAELKARIPKRPKRIIKVELITAGTDARRCRIIDTGLGMSEVELETKFGIYASAKAKGQRTRSLFGRGALDALLYHEDSHIYSVQNGILSSCRLYWDSPGEPMLDVQSHGNATKTLLTSLGLPPDISSAGTVVSFRLKEGTQIPQEDQIIAKLSIFYMLRLIAADPSTRVVITRRRAVLTLMTSASIFRLARSSVEKMTLWIWEPWERWTSISWSSALMCPWKVIRRSINVRMACSLWMKTMQFSI